MGEVRGDLAQNVDKIYTLNMYRYALTHIALASAIHSHSHSKHFSAPSKTISGGLIHQIKLIIS